MSDKGFGTRKETLEEEEVDFRFGKYKGMEAAALKREETNDDGYDDELGKMKKYQYCLEGRARADELTNWRD